MENKFCSCYFSFISSIIEQILKITQNYPIISGHRLLYVSRISCVDSSALVDLNTLSALGFPKASFG